MLVTGSRAIAFKEIFGISPNALNKLYKLNHIYYILKNKTTNNIFVSNMPKQWGFWYTGQFAKDYKKMFVELHSRTLSQN